MVQDDGTVYSGLSGRWGTFTALGTREAGAYSLSHIGLGRPSSVNKELCFHQLSASEDWGEHKNRQVIDLTVQLALS